MEEHGPAVRAVLRHLCRRPQDVDDAWQDTAVRVWKSLRQRPWLRNPRAWLCASPTGPKRRRRWPSGGCKSGTRSTPYRASGGRSSPNSAWACGSCASDRTSRASWSPPWSLRTFEGGDGTVVAHQHRPRPLFPSLARRANTSRLRRSRKPRRSPGFDGIKDTLRQLEVRFSIDNNTGDTKVNVTAALATKAAHRLERSSQPCSGSGSALGGVGRVPTRGTPISKSTVGVPLVGTRPTPPNETPRALSITRPYTLLVGTRPTPPNETATPTRTPL